VQHRRMKKSASEVTRLLRAMADPKFTQRYAYGIKAIEMQHQSRTISDVERLVKLKEIVAAVLEEIDEEVFAGVQQPSARCTTVDRRSGARCKLEEGHCSKHAFAHKGKLGRETIRRIVSSLTDREMCVSTRVRRSRSRSSSNRQEAVPGCCGALVTRAHHSRQPRHCRRSRSSSNRQEAVSGCCGALVTRAHHSRQHDTVTAVNIYLCICLVKYAHSCALCACSMRMFVVRLKGLHLAIYRPGRS
jgi:hypothetical protein